MQLVNEQDGAAALFQLVNGVFDPLLKFAPVFGTRQHSPKIQGDHPLVLQQLRNVAAGDPLGQALDNGAFAHAGVADEHRVVFRAAGQDLDDPLDLVFPANHRVQLPFPGQAGQVFAVLVQHRGIRVAGIVARALRLGGGAGKHLPQQAEITAQVIQNAHGHAVPLPQDGQQDVLGADVVIFQGLGLIQAQLQDLLRAGRIAEAVGKMIVPMSHQGVRPGGHILFRYGKLGQGPGGGAFPLSDQAEKQMLAAHIVMAHALGAFLGQSQGPPSAFCKAFDKVHMVYSYLMVG